MVLRGAEGGDAPARVDGLQHAVVVDLDVALLEQHAYLFRNDRHAEQRLVVGVVDDLRLATIAPTGQVVLGDEGVLQRGAGTFHLGTRAQEHAHAALVGELGHLPPGGLGRRRAVVDAAQTVLADQAFIHALDGGVVQLQAGGDHQEVVGHAAPRGGDHRVALGVDLRDALLDELHAVRHVINGARGHVAGRLDAGATRVKPGW